MRTDFDTEKTIAPPLRELQEKMLAEREYLRRRNDVPIDTGCDLRAASDAEIVDRLFRYHPPTPEQLPRYESINQAAKNFAAVILANCPPGADRSAAIRMLRECRMTANAAVALNGLSL